MNTRAIRLLSIGALGAGGMLLATTAAAVERGFYVGGMYGNSETTYSRGRFDEISRIIYEDLPQVSLSSTIDNKDSGYSFFGGYRLFRHLALEGGYIDLGKAVYRETTTLVVPADPTAEPPTPETEATYNQTFNLRTRGLVVTALGILPLNYRTELFARGGFLYASDKLNSSLGDGAVTVPLFDVSESNLHWIVGAGAGMTFAEVYTIRVEYQKIMDAGDKLWEETDVDLIGLGVTVAF